MADDCIKSQYARRFGLPEEQIRFFGELTPKQVDQVRQQFSAGLVDVGSYIYAVTRDGSLVWRREKRDPLMEMRGEFPRQQ